MSYLDLVSTKSLWPTDMVFDLDACVGNVAVTVKKNNYSIRIAGGFNNLTPVVTTSLGMLRSSDMVRLSYHELKEDESISLLEIIEGLEQLFIAQDNLESKKGLCRGVPHRKPIPTFQHPDDWYFQHELNKATGGSPIKDNEEQPLRDLELESNTEPELPVGPQVRTIKEYHFPPELNHEVIYKRKRTDGEFWGCIVAGCLVGLVVGAMAVYLLG